MNILSNFIRNKLKSILDEYFENNKVTQNFLNLTSNELVLKSVFIKIDKINKSMHNMPFELKSAYFESINLKIPWNNLFNSPLEIYVESPQIILILKDPNSPNIFDKKIAIENLFNEFKSIISKLISGNNSSKWKIFRNIQQKIIDNLQLRIQNITIRLDCSKLSGNPVLNFKLKDFNFFTSDENFQTMIFFDRTKVENQKLPIYKLLNINELVFNISDCNEENPIDIFKTYLNIQSKFFNGEDLNENCPQNSFNISISTLNILIDEKKLDYLISILKNIKQFNANLFNFLNFSIPRPTKTEDIGMMEEKQKKIYCKKWWFYCISIILKELYIKKISSIWETIYNKKNKNLKSFKLPVSILNIIIKPLRKHIVALIKNDFKIENWIHQPEELFDLEMILSNIPMIQIKNIILTHCMDLINSEIDKKKGMSIFKYLASKIGISFNQPDVEDVKLFISQKFKPVQNKSNFNYLLKFNLNKINLNILLANNNSFKTELFDLTILCELHSEITLATVSLKQIILYYKTKKQNLKIFNSEISKQENFAEIKFESVASNENNNIKINICTQTIFININPDILVYSHRFMLSRIRNPSKVLKSSNVSPTILKLQETIQNLRSNVTFIFDLSSLVLNLNFDNLEGSSNSLSFYTGNLQLKYNIFSNNINNSIDFFLQNMKMEYLINLKSETIVDFSILGKINLTNINNNYIQLISPNIYFNINHLHLLDLFKNLFEIYQKLIKNTDQYRIKQKYFVVKVSQEDHKDIYDLSYWKRSKQGIINFYNDKKIEIFFDKKTQFSELISNCKFTCIKDKSMNVLEVS